MNRFSIIVLTVTAAAAAPVALQAMSPIDSLAAVIAEANPAFNARRAELQSRSLSIQAENMLPGPELEGEHLWGPDGDNRWGAGISQSFDWPGVYSARRQARRASDNAFAQLAEAERAEQVLAAKLALIDLVAARHDAGMLRRIHSNVAELTELTQRALDHGQATILDLRKLQIEGIDISRRLEQAEQERSAAIAELRAMGYSGDVPDALDYPSVAPDYAAAASRWMSAPTLAAARAEEMAAKARAAAAARGCLPGFSLGYRHQYEGGSHFNGLSVGIALPAWGSSKAKAAARAEAEAARLQAEAQMAETTARFDDTRRRLMGLEVRRQQYRETLGGSDYTDLLRKSLEGGQISIITYIQELNFVMEALLSWEQVEKEYHTLLSILNKY